MSERPFKSNSFVPDIKHHITIKAEPSAVFAALATEAGLKSWWTVDAEGGEAMGEPLTVGFYHKAVVFRFTVAELSPNQRVVWECHGNDPDWANTRLTWELEPGDGSTALRFTHANWRMDDDHFASSNSTWGMLMYHLKGCLEGSGAGPKWTF